MQSYLGGTNKGSCYNYGYKTLSAGDNLKYITSGNNGNGYGDNERCYWQFYAPGAYGMGFRLEEIETRDGSDYMQVFMGTGTGGYHKLHFQTSHSTPYIWRDWSEFMSIFWHSDCCYTKDGIRANIWYYGKCLKGSDWSCCGNGYRCDENEGKLFSDT